MYEENGRFCLKENNDGTYSYSDADGNLCGLFDTIDEAFQELDRARDEE